MRSALGGAVALAACGREEPAPRARRFLRGAQATNAEGIAEIRTIFPGCYPGRTAHVHAKVFVGGGEALTTQLCFDDAVADEVYGKAPYAVRDRARNTDDRIFSPTP